MKTKLLIVLIFVSGLAICQIPTIQIVDSGSTDDFYRMFETLDTNYIETGILYDKILPFVDIYANNYDDSHTGQISSITAAIEKDEIMYTDMYLQNRTIDNDRDFEAQDEIRAGNNLLPLLQSSIYDNNNQYHFKNIIQNDFIVKSNTTVTFKAGQSISLESGFETEPGATFHTEIGNICPENKSMEVNIPEPVIIGSSKICDENTFTVENPDNTVIEWKLTGEKTNVVAYGNEFTTPEGLPPGQYSLSCISITNNGEASNSKNIKVICKNEVKNKKILSLSNSSLNIVVYPNPGKDIFYISINSGKVENSKVSVSIYDILNRKVYSGNVTYNDRIIVNLANKPSGIYYIMVYFNGKNYSQKIIKN